jgi:hypothetical protein
VSATTKTRLTPRQRLTRGLTYSAVGPLDITRATLGLGVQGAQAAAGGVRRTMAKSRSVPNPLDAGAAALAHLPQPLAEPRKARRRRLPWVLAACVLGLAAGGVAFSIVRRSMEPEPSPRPPSVDFDPKP